MNETNFVRPEQELLTDLVEQSLDSAGVRDPLAWWTWIETGSSHIVVLAGEVAVRVARTPETSAETLRSQLLVDALPPFPFDVPTSLSAPTSIDGIVAIASRRLTGEARPAGPGEPDELTMLLDAIHDVDLDTVRDRLAEPRSYSGGAAWYSIMTDRAIPRLPREIQPAAHRIADALESLAPDTVAFTHGDLAGPNILWEDGLISGVLDWDLASADDSADDLAAIAGWFGWSTVERFASQAEIARAKVFHDSFPLQALCFSLVNHRPDAEVERAVQNVTRRLSR